MKNHLKSKICKYCHRSFDWRKKWEKSWDEVLYCSKKCRGSNNLEIKQYKIKILEILEVRGHSKSICPSEVLEGNNKQDKKLMEKVRNAARALAEESLIEIQQKGIKVDPMHFKGPIRLKLKKSRV